MTSEDPVASVVWMIRGAWVTMSLRAGCELGVFDRLDVRRTPDELASLTGTDTSAILGSSGVVMPRHNAQSRTRIAAGRG